MDKICYCYLFVHKVPQASRAPSEKSIKSCSTSSPKSSSSSSKRREAIVNYKLAVLKQKQAQELSQTSLVGPAIATTIKSTNVVNATTQKYNPVPIAGPSSVITTFAEASTSDNLYNPAIKTEHFPDQSPSFGLDLTDKSIRYPSNAENVNAPFILQPPPGFY